MVALRSKSFVTHLPETLPIDLVRIYTAQIVQGLEYMQGLEIMHRDLKPQNLLLDDNYNIKFIDFGDAKKENEPALEDDEADAVSSSMDDTDDGGQAFINDLMEETKEMTQGRRGTFVGTVNYLAPEMIKDCQSTCASDLWALGCIVFKMATGKVPFPGTNITTVYPLIL
jgi:3-phosphoinositide dependent protein kinase-1